MNFLRYLGPGLLVTVGFIDPGNWASNIAAGSGYGYELLWMVTLSTIMLIFLQHNAAHLGIATGKCLFACGNVLHVHDLVDFVSEEAKTAGRNAAEYVKNLQSDTDDEEKSSKEDAADITLNPVEGVRYTVPSTINPAHMDENLTVRFRVGGVYKNCYVSAYFDDERVIHKKRPVVAPGEMEQIKLTKEQLMKYPDLKTITVKIEEA